MPDLDQTANVIDIIRKFSSKQLSTVIFLCVAVVSFVFWVENRYAKIEETRKEIEEIKSEIKKDKDQIFQLNAKTIEIFNTFPEEVKNAITEKSRAYIDIRNKMESN